MANHNPNTVGIRPYGIKNHEMSLKGGPEKYMQDFAEKNRQIGFEEGREYQGSQDAKTAIITGILSAVVTGIILIRDKIRARNAAKKIEQLENEAEEIRSKLTATENENTDENI